MTSQQDTATPKRTRRINKEQINEAWWTRYWRPAMAWQYLLVCLFDFVIAPLIYTQIQARGGDLLVQWQPLTLSGGGLYHLSMGAMLSIYGFNRTQERLELFKQSILPAPDKLQ